MIYVFGSVVRKMSKVYEITYQDCIHFVGNRLIQTKIFNLLSYLRIYTSINFGNNTFLWYVYISRLCINSDTDNIPFEMYGLYEIYETMFFFSEQWSNG